MNTPPCTNPVWSPTTDDELRAQTIAVLNRRNVIALAGGSPEMVAANGGASPHPAGRGAEDRTSRAAGCRYSRASRERPYRYLRRIVESGFGSRVMFGSDQMVWPGVIEHGIKEIENAPFLTPQQKQDILYNNAARFLRLSKVEIDRHHGR